MYSLDQVYPVVDGGPVEERYVFLVWLSNVKARLHQLSAALKDAIPANGRKKPTQAKLAFLLLFCYKHANQGKILKPQFIKTVPSRIRDAESAG